MRRILTTLMILLAVIVAGLTSLVLLVNPNDFRAYMVHEVAERSGYQLDLDGPLRWHVWPQLSILSGRMTLTAPGCPVAGEMPGWVENAVGAIPGIGRVDVNMTFDPPWSQDRMSDEARVALDWY